MRSAGLGRASGGHNGCARSGPPLIVRVSTPAIAKIAEIQVPGMPRTMFNVGRVGGGTSVNSIPFESWMEVDLRSSAPQESFDASDSWQGTQNAVLLTIALAQP